jgi:protein-tyrosine kinase
MAREKNTTRSDGEKAGRTRHQSPDIDWDLLGPHQMAYQRLAVWITSAPSRGQVLQTVLIVSPRASTGSTTTSALLAGTLAEGSKFSVLLVDGNLRTPTLDAVFNVRSSGGFTDVVAGDPVQASVVPTNHRNLSLLPIGTSTSPSSLFDRGAIDKAFVDLRSRFDFIIMDCAPVLEFPDACALAPHVNGIVLVIGAERTSVNEGQKAKRLLELAGGHVIGAVLNREKDYAPRFLRRRARVRV